MTNRFPLSRLFFLLLVALVDCVPAGLWAQGVECFPECRTGFVCAAGQCVESNPEASEASCIPTCRSGYACSAGQCVPSGTSSPESSVTDKGGRPLAAVPAIDYFGLTEQGERLAEVQSARLGGTHWDLFVFASGWSLAAKFEMKAPEKVNDGGWYPPTDTFDAGESGESWWGPLVGLAFGVRQNFSRYWGYQARLRVTAILYSDVVMVLQANERRAKLDGFGLTGSIDSTLRVGPFSPSFAGYFGLGGTIGAFYAQGDVRSVDNGEKFETTASTIQFLPGIVSELGVLLGEENDYDLGVRFLFEFISDSGFLEQATLNFGITLN